MIDALLNLKYYFFKRGNSSNIIKKEFSSPAKVNLFLRVLEKKVKLHKISSLMVPYPKLSDKILIEIDKANHNSKTKIIFNKNELLVKNSTVLTAVNIMRNKYKISNDIFIKIKKNIPIGSGLGGGSSNGAVVLKGINEMLKLNISKSKLKKLAFLIGSDSPFFIDCVASLVSDLGNVVRPVRIKTDFLFEVKPIEKKSFLTRDVYQNYIISDENQDKYKKIIENIKKRNLFSYKWAFNDLEKPILKENKDLHRFLKLQRNKYLNAIVCGAGKSIIIFKKRK